jgi:hypothetical protein
MSANIGANGAGSRKHLFTISAAFRGRATARYLFS